MKRVHQVYRLTLDEDGVEDVQDYTKLEDARAAFEKAKRRRSVFSIKLVDARSDGQYFVLDGFER